MKRLSILFALIITFLPAAAQGVKRRGNPAYPFIVITSDTVSKAPTFTDREFSSLSTQVRFKASKSDISADDPFYRLYTDEILPRINNQHLQLRKIYIRGAASPEGPYAFNKRLGQERAAALLKALQHDLRFQYINTEIDVVCVTEDYSYLCLLMQDAGDKDYELVREICNSCGDNEKLCKQRLMKAQGGRLWKRILKEYFPQLRTARLILWFSEPDEEHTPERARFDTVAALPGLPLRKLAYADNSAIIPQGPWAKASLERRHLLAVRTNLLHDFLALPEMGVAFSPNLQLEYYPVNGHWTYNAGFSWGNWRKWDSHRFFQVRDAHVELRRYFRGEGNFTGLYSGLSLHGNMYGIGFDPKKGWQGEGGAAALSLGWVQPLTRKGDLRLEVMMELGSYFTLYDPYVWGNPVTGTVDGKYYYNFIGSASAFKRRNHLFYWMGPVNAGVQLTYDILYRKRQIRR